jgi:hypothetical protein
MGKRGEGAALDNANQGSILNRGFGLNFAISTGISQFGNS